VLDASAHDQYECASALVLAMSREQLTRLQAPANQSLGVFTGVIVLITVGSLVVTVQAKVSMLPSSPNSCR
jgi:hypothetical protein